MNKKLKSPSISGISPTIFYQQRFKSVLEAFESTLSTRCHVRKIEKVVLLQGVCVSTVAFTAYVGLHHTLILLI